MATASPRPRPKIMTLSPSAAQRVNEIVAKSDTPKTLRVGVKNGGCAGMEYTMEWAEAPGKFDEVIEDQGVKVLIDAKAVMFLLGTQMDFQATALKSGFVFINPNQTSACGCGESVQLKAATA